MKKILILLMLVFAFSYTSAQSTSSSTATHKPKDPCKDPRVRMDPFNVCNNIGYDNVYLKWFQSGKIKTPPPFGGPITLMVSGCFYGITWVRVGPPRPGYYVYKPDVTRVYSFGPPSHIGQYLLGLYAPKYFCTKNLSGGGLIVLPGLLITMMGSSR